MHQLNLFHLSITLLKHELSVNMTCEGCSSAVSRVLNKLEGVEFDIDLPNKKVCINSEHSVDLLLETLGKTGKAVSYLGSK
uniref:Copper transport protein ATOX1 n=1 Tax=Suricata suricatta TaxID=37032 RepID=A0A673TVV1_SURSU